MHINSLQFKRFRAFRDETFVATNDFCAQSIRATGDSTRRGQIFIHSLTPLSPNAENERLSDDHPGDIGKPAANRPGQLKGLLADLAAMDRDDIGHAVAHK